MIDNEKLSTILDKAAARIERKGWCKGTLADADGRLCALGAIAEATACCGMTDLDEIIAYRFSAEYALAVQVFGGTDLPQSAFTYVATWNDHESKDAQEVIDAFRSAAKGVRSME